MALIEVLLGGLGMNNYKYNGKEWQDELGLNMYAMDMRQYDPAIARWVVQDPIVHHSQSPYNGYDCNPVFFADPSGGDTNTLMGADLDGNVRYNNNGQWMPYTTRTNMRIGYTEMDEDMGINADGNVFNEISVHTDEDGSEQGDPDNPRVLNWYREGKDGSLWEYANSDEFAPKNILVLYTHATKDYIWGPNKEEIRDPKTLESYLIKYSPDYKKFKEKGGKFTLVIKACYAAEGDENVVKNIAQ